MSGSDQGSIGHGVVRLRNVLEGPKVLIGQRIVFPISPLKGGLALGVLCGVLKTAMIRATLGSDVG